MSQPLKMGQPDSIIELTHILSHCDPRFSLSEPLEARTSLLILNED